MFLGGCLFMWLFFIIDGNGSWGWKNGGKGSNVSLVLVYDDGCDGFFLLFCWRMLVWD